MSIWTFLSVLVIGGVIVYIMPDVKMQTMEHSRVIIVSQCMQAAGSFGHQADTTTLGYCAHLEN